MKVLHINCNYFGHNPVHINMIKTLDKIVDIENWVFSPVSKEIVDNSNERIIACKCINKYDRLFFNHKSRKIRKNLLKNVDIRTFDLLHAYTVFTDGNVAYELNKKYGIPYVVAVRSTDVEVFLRYMPHLRKKGIKIMENASRIFFLSESYKKYVFDNYIPKKKKNIIKKCVVIPNGIDNFWLDNIYNNQESFDKKIELLKNKSLKIVYAGDINTNKNLLTTCKAIDYLKNEGWNIEYIVAGRIKSKKIFNKIKKYIDYRGKLSKENLLDIYRKAHIFVMPSFKETFGIVYAEAISQGLPVVYSKGQGFDCQFEEGTVGFHVDSNNYKDIVDVTYKIIDNYKTISNKCIKCCESFNWNNLCKLYEKIYKEIIEKRG